MAIKNYTTTINANKTIGEIQELLSKHGATAIMTEYSNGNVTGLSFKIMTPRGEFGIRLPSNTDRVLQVLKNQRKNNNQVIDAQMAILETEMVEMEQIFLPYIINNKGQTVYEVFENNTQLLLK